MLYQAATKTVIEVVPPDVSLDEDRLRELATYLGCTSEGREVEKVALVFVGGRDDAEPHAGDARRFGLEVRYLDHTSGEEKVLVHGARVQTATDGSYRDDQLVAVLREQSWPHLDTAVHRRLLDGPADVGGPWVTFGWDAPTTLARFAPKDLAASGRTIAELEALALANLARRTFTPTVLRPGALGVRGSEYCAEAILLPEIMTACAETLGCQLMAVAVPKENILVAVDAGSYADVAFLLGTTREMFDTADGRRISPLPFLVGQGKPIGLVSPSHSSQSQELAKKPWYKFW